MLLCWGEVVAASMIFLNVATILVLPVSGLLHSSLTKTTITMLRRKGQTVLNCPAAAAASDDTDKKRHYPRDDDEAKTNILILLDRDGVINEDVGSPGIIDPKQVRLTPNAGNAIGRLRTFASRNNNNNIAIVMITNQSCVGKRLITEVQLDEIQVKVQQLLLEENSVATIDQIYQCTSKKSDKDPRMKPSPDMIFEAMNDYQLHDGLSSSTTTNCDDKCIRCFVGDTTTDLQAAAAADVDLRILVSTGYGQELMNGKELEVGDDPIPVSNNTSYNTSFPDAVFPFLYCRNLDHAADCILAYIKGRGDNM